MLPQDGANLIGLPLYRNEIKETCPFRGMPMLGLGPFLVGLPFLSEWTLNFTTRV
ncbi:hypothetical protein [Oceanobacillus indicireducens]|uniref:Uncharacterized protein n=1 Tax=Oceanobacillus indicireducens TaxID=1004261 RepID=A0A917XZ38_9BACI|nr:hypothetical protein [Oceanobacillus indicireducens]GGN57732.1 hypothetical protein GCM10007971_19020 [Oceanobacillus indicireducens]